jgi:tetratricopeptide (TPR) repeat protein
VRRAALGAAFCALLAAFACAQGDAGPPAPAPAQDRALEGYARLVELAELGFAAELIATGLPLVQRGGELGADGQAGALVARALFGAGREAEAFALLDAAAPRAGDDAGRAALDLMRARLHLERDELAQALRILTARPGAYDAPRHPRAADNLLLLGRALVRLERRDLAEPMLQRFVAAAPLSPEAPAAWHMLFDCALGRGDVERAKACRAEKERLELWHQLLVARRVQIHRAPDARLPRLGLALLWLEVGALDEARAALEGLLARFPSDAEAWLHLGEVHRRAGRMDAARQAWTRLLELHPEEQRARYNLAILHRVQGRAAEARRELETLLAGPAADDARFLGAHWELARLLQAAGEVGAARERYAAYLERGGTDPLL